MATNDKKDSKALVKVTTVAEGIDAVNQKIEALKFLRETTYKTTGKYEGRDIKTITDISELINIHSAISLRTAAYEASAKALGRKDYKSKTFEGATLEQWEEDIKFRIKVIEQEDTLKELEAIKKEYNELLDRNDRMELLAHRMTKL